MLISVIIPAYNNASNLDKTLASVYQQTYNNLEIIVVNDCSSDNTTAVIEKHFDAIKYINLPENKGGSAARNAGFAESSGEYLAFLDADDMWKPTFIEDQLSAIEGTSFSAVYCHAEDEIGNVLGGTDQGVFIKELLLGTADIVSTSALFIRRKSFVEIGGFDPAFQRHQDLEFVICIMKKGIIGVNPKVLFYKINSASPVYVKALLGINLFWSKFNEDINSLSTFDRKWVYAKGKLRLSELAINQGLWVELVKNTLSFIFLNPFVIIPRLRRYIRKALAYFRKDNNRRMPSK
ncbi:MAG: glycosyltransferase involved in cell wall biosynthesis [Polaribacter sp.]|jgi:glycosyltransferase involved in cell wall biosynthesis